MEKVCPYMTGLPVWPLHLVSRECEREGSCSLLGHIFSIGKSSPLGECKEKINSMEEDVVPGSPSYPDIMTLKNLQIIFAIESKLHAGSDLPCARFCVTPPTSIHCCLGKWFVPPLVPTLNSQTSLLEKLPPALRAKLDLKPKHLPGHSCSLKAAPWQSSSLWTPLTICH